MKTFSLLLAAGVASLASASTLDELIVKLPPCAVACLDKYVPKTCPKGLADFSCECNPVKKAKIQTASSNCVFNGCSQKDALLTLDTTDALCKEYNANGYSGDPTHGKITAALTTIPSCAVGCFQSVIPKYCPKGLADFACQCAKVTTLTPPLTTCIQGVCSNSEALAAKRSALEVCQLYSAAEGGGSSSGTGGTAIVTPTAPTGFTGPGSNDAPLATAGPLGAAIAAAIAFAL